MREALSDQDELDGQRRHHGEGEDVMEKGEECGYGMGPQFNPLGILWLWLNSQRQIIVLPAWHLDLLALEHGQRARDAAEGRVRHDDVVDIAALGGDEGRQKAV